ncbi:hypothetical protein R6Q59_035985 [Mikania micrantha]|uniref:C2 domain-containing protein n=1 Tax=Mikania micrantha TaxID=192012 RepID=A0A5N6NEI5_9ASTR|nr:hypothetical protein E3N88_22989 [Mikania micrantha]
MEYRILDLILASAKGLKRSTFFGRSDVYAVASISGTTGKIQKLPTTVHKNGGSNPTWNFPMKFIFDEAGVLQNRVSLVVKIKSVRLFHDKSLGEVHVPIKELMDGAVKTEGNAMQSVSCQVNTRSGKPKGVLNFWFELGERFVIQHHQEPVPVVQTGESGAGTGLDGEQLVGEIVYDTASDGSVDDWPV